MVLLTFDLTADENNITSFDTLSLKYATIKINENFKRGTLFLREIDLASSLKIKEEFKYYKDKAVIVVKFILLVTPSAI